MKFEPIDPSVKGVRVGDLFWHLEIEWRVTSVRGGFFFAQGLVDYPNDFRPKLSLPYKKILSMQNVRRPRPLSKEELLEQARVYEQRKKVVIDFLNYGSSSRPFTLSDRELEVMLRLNGLHGYEIQSHEEVGKVFDVTRERIRQIEAKAIEKIHDYRRAQGDFSRLN